MASIDPLTAIAVVIATAATDAVYVMFTSAVVARRRVPAASWEQHLVSALFLCGDQQYRKLGLSRLRRGRLLDRGVCVDHISAPAGRRTSGRCRAGLKGFAKRL